MAILKHIASKSADYTKAMDYLMYEWDRTKNCPKKDDHGFLIVRENYLIDSLECEVHSFDVECIQLNRQYGKNQKYDEIKSHHYIISFDPKDSVDGELTIEKAQEIGMDYAKKNFPGHQALVCTHGDGENKRGNIHVHIIINSLRKRDVERQNFMERKIDSLAGYKHHLTRQYLAYLKRDLMDVCQKEKLHQVDLLSPAKKKVTEKEYWADVRGKQALGSDFELRKESLRKAIGNCAKEAKSEKEFFRLLKERHNIVLKISRGRYGYLLPGREKPIRGRMLGTDYTEDYLRNVFEENAKHVCKENTTENTSKKPTNKTKAKPSEQEEKDALIKELAKLEKMSGTKVPREVTMPTELPLVRDLQLIALTNASYTDYQPLKIRQLKEMAETLLYVENHGFKSMDDIEKHFDSLRADTSEKREALKDCEESINALNEQIHYTGQYLANRGVYQEYLNLKGRKKERFHSEHEPEIIIFESARRYLKKHADNGTLPSLAYIKSAPGKFVPIETLKKKRSELIAERNDLRPKYYAAKDASQEFYAIKRKVDNIFRDIDRPKIRTRHYEEML